MSVNYELPLEELHQKIFLAIWAIRPNSCYSVHETYDSLVWKDESQKKPTEAEFDQAVADFHQKYNAKQYVRDRKTEYPTTQQLVVALYDENDKQALIDKRAAVKAKYPKPECSNCFCGNTAYT